MQILLAGATGVIGSPLLRRLVEEGHTVFGTTRRPDRQHQISSAGGHPLIMDALDSDSVRETVEQSVPELIMHQLTDLATLDFAGNANIRVSGPRHLVDAAKAYGCRRMITQSIAWAYRAGESPADEDETLDLDAPGRGAATNAAVAAMEATVGELPHAVVLRFGLLYGPGTWFAPDGPRAEETGSGQPPPATALVHIDDAVEAAVRAVEWPAGPVNIVEDEPAPAATGRAVSNGLARSQGWAPTHDWQDTWTDRKVH